MEDIHLPHDIIENILSRLPVKSLLRFKAVCKQWNANICDLKFTETHLQRSKNSSSSCLLEDVVDTHRIAQLVDFENDQVTVISAIDRPPVMCYTSPLLCHCDGLYLFKCFVGSLRREYVLWNPSCRTDKRFNCPYIFIDYISSSTIGICYDPLVKDYKVVIGDGQNYAVFNCKSSSWSEKNEMNINAYKNYISFSCAVSFKGSIYWVCFSATESRYDIVYLDGRDEKFKNLREVDERAENACLISSGEGLYLFTYYGSNTTEILFMKRVDGDDEAWIEVKVQLPLDCCRIVWPLCCTGEDNKIVVRYSGGEQYLVFDVSERSLAEVGNRWGLRSGCLFPYVENLLWL